jgi:cephalosporin-C deacetylase
MIMKKLVAFLFVSVFTYQVMGQIRGYNIRVTVTPDHKDWTYSVGQKVTFTVNVLKSGTLLDNAKVDYEMGPEMYPEIKKKDVVLKDGTMTTSSTMKKAGFLRLKVIAHVDGKDYDGMCTAAFSPEKIQPVATCPKDFDEFWSNALKEARYTSLEPTRELLPERCTKDVNVYQVSFQNIRWGSRTYGILCVPVKPGKYPALLHVPGAGIRPYAGDVWTASKGAITLEIGIHGIPVTMSQDYYDKLAAGALNCYWNFNRNNRDEFYYKRVFVGAIRAIDYICSLPEWNGAELGVTGSSQGGMLSLVCAALDKRVTFYGAVHAAMCDHTASLEGIACGWPHYFYGQKNPDPKEVETSRYYDGINFARRITVPGWFSFGYNDDVVPPTTAYATYNVVTAKKEIHPYPETRHFWYQEQYDEWNAWLWSQMGIK